MCTLKKAGFNLNLGEILGEITLLVCKHRLVELIDPEYILQILTQSVVSSQNTLRDFEVVFGEYYESAMEVDVNGDFIPLEADFNAGALYRDLIPIGEKLVARLEPATDFMRLSESIELVELANKPGGVAFAVFNYGD